MKKNTQNIETSPMKIGAKFLVLSEERKKGY